MAQTPAQVAASLTASDIQKVVSYVIDSYNQGMNPSNPKDRPYLAAVLRRAGWNNIKINKYLSNPSLGRTLLGSAGQGLLGVPLPGVAAGLAGGADTAASGAATAAEGAAGGGVATAAAKGAAGTAASDIAKAAAGASFVALLTDPSFLFRVLKFIGGLLLGYLGLKQLASAGGGSSAIRTPVPVPV
jgi:hypothetical protein